MAWFRLWSFIMIRMNIILAYRTSHMHLHEKNSAILLKFIVQEHMKPWMTTCPCPACKISGVLYVITQTNLISLHQEKGSMPTIMICNHTFELIHDHLASISYNGPVALSCDDTKLFSTFWLYWDSAQQAHFLIGTLEGPVKFLISIKCKVWCDAAFCPCSALGENLEAMHKKNLHNRKCSKEIHQSI